MEYAASSPNEINLDGQSLTLHRLPEKPEPEQFDEIEIPERFIPSNKIKVPKPIVKTTALDWLQISMVQPMEQIDKENGHIPRYFKENRIEEFEKGSWHVRPVNSPNRVYKKAYRLYFHGAEFALLHCVPYSSGVKSPDSIQVKINNEWLYSDWLDAVKSLMTVFHLRMTGISRVDIACDGFDILSPIQLYDKGYLRMKKRTKLCRWSWSNKETSGFLLGSRQSTRYCRAYHKNQEIEQSSKKYYIQKFWEANGIKEKDFDRMERVEVVLKSSELKNLFPHGVGFGFLKKLLDPSRLQSLAASCLNDLYQFTEQPPSEKTNVSRLKKVAEIVYNGTTEKISRSIKKGASKIRAIQMAIKCNYQLYLKTDIEKFRWVAHELIEECDLGAWWKKRKPSILYEYELAKKKERPFYPLYHGENKTLFDQPTLTRRFVGI